MPEIIGRKEENGKRIGFGRNQKPLVFNMKTMGRESVRGREEEMRMITQDNRIKKRVWGGDFILKSWFLRYSFHIIRFTLLFGSVNFFKHIQSRNHHRYQDREQLPHNIPSAEGLLQENAGVFEVRRKGSHTKGENDGAKEEKKG